MSNALAVAPRATEEPRGWVLLLVGSERHFFVGKGSVCGLHFVPAIAEGDYETRQHDRVKNCWMCEEALERFDVINN